MVEHLPSMHEVGGLTCRAILKENGLVGHGRGKPQAHDFLHALQTIAHYPLSGYSPKGLTIPCRGPAPDTYSIGCLFISTWLLLWVTSQDIIQLPQMYPVPALFCELHPHVPKCYAMYYCPLGPRTLKLNSLLLSP